MVFLFLSWSKGEKLTCISDEFPVECRGSSKTRIETGCQITLAQRRWYGLSGSAHFLIVYARVGFVTP
ncbi:Protein of unknown function [Anaplasma phagocytophilum]|uniref:Uncharacterized protein n=1 Tax=Anaplasma phagocytophilum TaxID=948 RepID=A0A098EFG2_ANAPH|nr:Protein of unknown function [Anaplasma phagocytophilum]